MPAARHRTGERTSEPGLSLRTLVYWSLLLLSCAGAIVYLLKVFGIWSHTGHWWDTVLYVALFAFLALHTWMFIQHAPEPIRDLVAKLLGKTPVPRVSHRAPHSQSTGRFGNGPARSTPTWLFYGAGTLALIGLVFLFGSEFSFRFEGSVTNKATAKADVPAKPKDDVPDNPRDDASNPSNNAPVIVFRQHPALEGEKRGPSDFGLEAPKLAASMAWTYALPIAPVEPRWPATGPVKSQIQIAEENERKILKEQRGIGGP